MLLLYHILEAAPNLFTQPHKRLCENGKRQAKIPTKKKRAGDRA
jgi:hypothetical protein